MGGTKEIDDLKAGLLKNDNYLQAVSRLNALLDDSGINETGALVEASGVVTGSGLIDGRSVYVYSQYGPVNLVQAGKIANIYSLAVTTGTPVIGILDSKGMELSGALDTLEAYAIICKTMADASGVIPQISLVLGGCMGAASLMCGLSDFVFMTEKSRLFMQSPAVFAEAKMKEDYVFSGKYHFEVTGSADFLGSTEEEIFTEVKSLLNHLPANNLEEPPVLLWDGLNQSPAAIGDVRSIVSSLCDGGRFLEVKEGFGKEIVTGLCHINGYGAGIVANNGQLTAEAVKKTVKFIAFCDAFNIPLITLIDACEFGEGLAEGNLAIDSGAALVYAFSNATVPKINIITKNAAGSLYLIMNSKYLGADFVYAWEGAVVSLFSPKAMEKVLESDENLLVCAASKGFVDDIIPPENTKKVIAAAMESLYAKRLSKHPKKHGSIVF